jgi:predicted ATPase/class 3 adenylate cyclase
MKSGAAKQNNPSSGIADRSQDAPRVQGERRVVTILFCDVAGSTAIAEQLDPEEWAEIMDEAFEIFISPVQRYDGKVARLMGDAILAFFGAPLAHEDDPQRAVLAGLEILSGIQPLREEMKLDYGMDFNVRIGINTGPVVVAEVGLQDAGEYTAMGDAVNLAARMEQSARPGTVQISADTYRWVAPFFEVEKLGKHAIKGKSEAVETYRVIKRKTTPGRVRGIEGLSAPIIGREDEMNRMKAVLAQVQNGRGQIVSIMGDAGIGKSRLIEETRREWENSPDGGNTWIESRGVSFDSAFPYGLFRQILRQSCGLVVEDPPEIIQKRILDLLDRLPESPNGNREKIKKAAEILLETNPGKKGALPEGKDLKQILYDGFRTFLMSLSAQSPAAFVFDDLHWADHASIDLLVDLFSISEQAPVLFLTSFRPYRQSPGWQVKNSGERDFPNRYLLISLKPLTEIESGELVDSLLSVAELPAQLQNKILSKSEGNPFFVEEVVRTLIESGAVVRDEARDKWVASRKVEEIDIPDNLQALILARIDRLEKEARSTLQLASVIGRSFYYRVLARITEESDALEQNLNTLERLELVVEQALKPEREYLFRHELTRDAAYKSILRRQQRRYHRMVAEAIENLFSDYLDEEAHRLAYHFYRARNFQKALEYYTIAADKSAGLYANDEAIQHYSHALELTSTVELPKDELIHLYTSLGRVYEVSGDFEKAMATYKELEEMGAENGDEEMILAALIPQATIYSIPSDQINGEQGRAVSEHALALARELGDHRAESKVLWNLLLLEELILGNKESAYKYGEQAIEIARKYDLKEELAYALHDMTRVYFESGMVEEALSAFEESNRLWRELKNLPILADNLGAAAQGLYYMGEFNQALEKATEGVDISREINNNWGHAYNQVACALILAEFGHVSEAVNALQESAPLARKANFSAGEMMVHGYLSWLYGTFGDVQRARENEVLLNEKLHNVDRFGNYKIIWEGLISHFEGDSKTAFGILDENIQECCLNVMDDYVGPLLANILSSIAVSSGEFRTALRISNESIASMKELHMRLFLPDILMAKGRSLLELGEKEAGYKTLYDAYNQAISLGSRRSALFVLAELVQAELERDNESKAAELRLEGQELVEYISSKIDDTKLQIAFLSSKPARALLA